MNIDLYKMPKNAWTIVVSGVRYDSSSIEEAADLLEACGVASDEIDAAIISIVTNNHTRANFGVIKGTFIFSDTQSIFGDQNNGNT